MSSHELGEQGGIHFPLDVRRGRARRYRHVLPARRAAPLLADLGAHLDAGGDEDEELVLGRPEELLVAAAQRAAPFVFRDGGALFLALDLARVDLHRAHTLALLLVRLGSLLRLRRLVRSLRLNGRRSVHLLRLLGGGHFQRRFRRFRSLIAAQRQKQLAQLLARKTLGAAPKPKALGAQDAPSQAVVRALELDDDREHLVHGAGTFTASHHAHELGLQRLEPLLALYLHFWIERHARAQKLARDGQRSRRDGGLRPSPRSLHSASVSTSDAPRRCVDMIEATSLAQQQIAARVRFLLGGLRGVALTSACALELDALEHQR